MLLGLPVAPSECAHLRPLLYVQSRGSDLLLFGGGNPVEITLGTAL